MKTIYFVRHGEAEHNVASTMYRNGPESQLTERGIAQSKFIAARATKLPIEALIASPYIRTKKTAEYISAATGIPLEFSELFTEVAPPTTLFGREAGDPEVRDIEAQWERTIFAGDRVLDGENYDDISRRAIAAVRYLEERSENHIMLVSHGFFARFLIARMIFGDDVTPEITRKITLGFKTINTGLTLLRHDANETDMPWWVYVWNDHAHLAE